MRRSNQNAHVLEFRLQLPFLLLFPDDVGSTGMATPAEPVHEPAHHVTRWRDDPLASLPGQAAYSCHPCNVPTVTPDARPLRQSRPPPLSLLGLAHRPGPHTSQSLGARSDRPDIWEMPKILRMVQPVP